jgi:maleate isomerase
MPGAAADAAQHGAGLAPAGVTTVGARGLGCTDNLAAAAVAPGAILEAARALMAEARPDAILVWSTNLPGFEVMAALEAETGITVLDSAAVGVAAALAAAGVPTAPLAGLGRMFGAG